MWASSGQNDRKNLKLKVQFNYPDPSSAASSSARGDGSGGSATSRSVGVSENVEIVRNRLAHSSASSASGAASGGNSEDSHWQNLTPEAIHAELMNLKKKYDVVVEYTVHLTAERDTLMAQMEELQREYAREANRNNKGDTPRGMNKAAEGNEKQLIQKVIQLIQ